MIKSSLDTFISGARAAWGLPVSAANTAVQPSAARCDRDRSPGRGPGRPPTETVVRVQRLMEEFARAPQTEPWLAALLRDPTEGRELYRDPEHGFLLLAHTEREGRYRAPHDHGRGWVIYAVQHGEMEMGSYARLTDVTDVTDVTDARSTASLVRRDVSRVRAGECRVYLPGDIHDTRCVSRDVLMLRLTSCDLKLEDREGRLTRYALGPAAQ